MSESMATSGDSITVRQYMVLRLIARKPGVQSGDIRQMLEEGDLKMTYMGVRNMLKQMEAKGWIATKVKTDATATDGKTLPMINSWKLTKAGGEVFNKVMGLLVGKKKEK